MGKTKYDAQFMEVADLPPFAVFVSRVTEMYPHNIVHYPEENLTLDGAFREVLVDIVDEVILTEQRSAEDGQSKTTLAR